MKKIIFGELSSEQIPLSSVKTNRPIFAKKNGVLSGMIVEENGRWICRIGGGGGVDGHHETAEKCMRSCLKYSYEFFVN